MATLRAGAALLELASGVMARRILRLVMLGGAAALQLASAQTWPDDTASSARLTAQERPPPYPPSPVISGMTFDFSFRDRRAPGSDNWPVTWGDDDRQYTAWGDGGGFGRTDSDGRVSLGVARVEGPRGNYRGQNVWGGKDAEPPARVNGKSYGILSVEGVLYLWVSPGSDTQNYAEARLYHSANHGVTWTPVDWTFAQSDGIILPTFCQFGKGYAGARDGYVYIYAIRLKDASALKVQQPGEVDLMRVPKHRIMDRSAYEFFAGLAANGDPTWTPRLSARHSVFADPNGVGWCLSVSCNAGLKRYLLCTEHSESFRGNLGIFDAPEPWGPWTAVGYYRDWGGLGSTFFWNFANKWLSADGKHFTMVFTGTDTNDAWNTMQGMFTTARSSSGKRGALSVYHANPGCFQTAGGQPVLLIGDYTWGTFSDVDYDYKAMFDALQAHGLNFARVWLWWGCEQFPPPGDNRHTEPFLRPGPGQANDGRPKYDLTQFNPVFFDRLRDFCAAARERGLFLQLITMAAWMLKHPHLWKLHAFHRDNNVNGVDGDPRRTGKGTDGQQGFCSPGNSKALEFPMAYLRKLVEALNDFAHVLIEIANENYYSAEWERHWCGFIRELERGQPRQHLLMPLDLLNHSSVVQTWDVKRIRAALLEKRRLRQPLIFDTDWTITQNDDEVRKAAWAAVLSGGHFNYMDDSFQTDGEHHGDVRGRRRADLHRHIGALAAFTRQMRPWEMEPDARLVKKGTAFALGSTNELAAYLPGGGRVTLDLSKLAGPLEAWWFNPRKGEWGVKLPLAGGRSEDFAAPSADGDWALLVRRRTDASNPATPIRVQANALSPSSVQVSWRNALDAAVAAAYQVFRDGAEVATTVLPSHTDVGLAPEKRYAYTVAALDLHGNRSPPSVPPAQVTTPARPPFCQVNLGTENKGERLKQVTDADGDTRPAKAGDRDCREPATAQDPYFYFAIDDGYLFNEAALTCRLEVTYFDEAGFIEPQFDSVAGAYTSAKRIDLTGTRDWRTAAWQITGCKFANRQNAGADFRLFVGPNQVKVARIKLSPLADHADAFGVHPSFPRQFLYRRQPFFFVGKSTFALVDADWRGFIDEAQRDGFSVLRVWLCCPALTRKHGKDHFQRNQAAGDVWPFGGTPAQPDFSRFNQEYFRRLDASLDHMDSKDMVAELTLFSGGDFWPGGPLAWDDIKQRYVQFVLDRYRDRPNLYYEIANEYYSAEQQAFVEKVGDFIWERDKAHLVTASAGELARFADKPWYRLHSFHPSRGRNWWTRVYDEVLLPARQARLPLVNDEPMGSRAADDKEEGYPGRDVDAAHHRMNFWITVLGGGHVTFHSHKGINALAGYSPGQEFVKPLRTFFEQVRLGELQPASERVKGGAAYVAASGTQLVAYLPANRSVTLDLSGLPSLLAARWFDPRAGAFGKSFKVESGEQREFQAPDGNDWVLLLQKAKRETK